MALAAWSYWPETGVAADSSTEGGSALPVVKLRFRGTDFSEEEEERLLVSRLLEL